MPGAVWGIERTGAAAALGALAHQAAPLERHPENGLPRVPGPPNTPAGMPEG